jgi:uncharacterized protein
LISSLYENSTIYAEIIRAIAKHRDGISRDELLAEIQTISDGGRLTNRLNSLEVAGFIASFTPIGYAKKGTCYRIIDEYTLFYFTWIELLCKKSRLSQVDSHYWETKSRSHAWQSWAGHAFEAVCFKHILEIRKALGIDHIASEFGSWHYRPSRESKEKGAQIDMLFDRSDGCVILCEIKFSEKPFVLSRDYAAELEYKRECYIRQTKTNKQVFIALIASSGVKKNQYADKLISQVVTLDNLF